MQQLLSFLVRRLAAALLLLMLLTMITFFAYWKIPNEPAAFIVNLRNASPADIRKARHQLGVDRPIYVQYGKFVWRALRGDFGQSFAGFDGTGSGVPVASQVVRAAGVTGSIALGGAVLLLLVALPLGMLSATWPQSTIDRAGAGLSIVGISLHPLVVALLLQLFLASRWHWLPQEGYCRFIPASDAPCSGPAAWAEHLALPWVTFALFFVALYSRMIRARMLDVLGEPYIRTARAKGATQRRILFRHALPNTVLPLVTMLAMDIGTAISICVYIEAVFRMPGLGVQTIVAIEGFGLDLPMLLGIVLFTGTAIIVLNLLVDLAAVLLDPTISHSATGRSARYRLSRTG
jgi:peptide/nickel transport system permease protein